VGFREGFGSRQEIVIVPGHDSNPSSHGLIRPAPTFLKARIGEAGDPAPNASPRITLTR
jgi:hypothetical protein